jgi:NAD(P)-dependent dehydrogenase (short-subunit alcohol dehydrogenase family)
MSNEFAGRTVLVAGGTGGLGRAVSLAFLAEGARVVVTHRKPEEFDALRADAGARASSLDGRRVDVTDPAAVRAAVAEIAAARGGIDVLVNAVGGYAGGQPLWEADEADLERMWSQNVRAGWVLARAVAPHMLERGRGAIVNVASRSAVEHSAGQGAYAASKAAALAMTDSLAADLKGRGVRVNSVLPSIIDTPANRRAMPKANFASWPKPEEIARVILFLCSDDAALVHGAAIPV